MRLAPLLLAACLLAGCSVNKILQPIGGSRADGTVTLAYEYAEMESPQPQWDDALQKAKQRCLAWGYQNAELFGGVMKHCQQSGGISGCLQWQVTATYQCQSPTTPPRATDSTPPQ